MEEGNNDEGRGRGPLLADYLVVLLALTAFGAGWTTRGPVEHTAADLRYRQATVRLAECRDAAETARTDAAVAWLVGWGAVAVAQDLADRVIQGGSREDAARIKYYLTRGE